MTKNKSMNEVTSTHPNNINLPIIYQDTYIKEIKRHTIQILLYICSLMLNFLKRVFYQIRTQPRNICRRFAKMATYKNMKFFLLYIYDSKFWFRIEMFMFWSMVAMVVILAIISYITIFLYKTLKPPIREIYRYTYSRRNIYKIEIWLIISAMAEDLTDYFEEIRKNYAYFNSVIEKLKHCIDEHEASCFS